MVLEGSSFRHSPRSAALPWATYILSRQPFRSFLHYKDLWSSTTEQKAGDIRNIVLELPPAPAALVLVGRAFATLSARSAAAFLLIAVLGPPGGDRFRPLLTPAEAGGEVGEEGRGEDWRDISPRILRYGWTRWSQRFWVCSSTSQHTMIGLAEVLNVFDWGFSGCAFGETETYHLEKQERSTRCTYRPIAPGVCFQDVVDGSWSYALWNLCVPKCWSKRTTADLCKKTPMQP